MTSVHTPADGSRSQRAAVYGRVSTEDQAREGFSLPEQERRGQELISREGWTPAGTFIDPGVSGAVRDRPALGRLLEEVAAGRIDVVVVVALDRLSRDAGHLRELLLTLDAAGVRVVASGQALDRATPEGRLQTGILAEFAEFEKAKIQERTRNGIAGRARAGKPWGRYPPYGYLRGDDGHWLPDPAERDIYVRIFRERTEYARSYSGIAKLFNAEEVPTRTPGASWGSTLVRKILAGRYGLGEFRHNGEWIKGRHEPLIDEATWEAAQALAALGDRFTPSRGGRRPALHLFTNGLLRCGICFEAMLPRGEGDRYTCRTNKQIKGAGGCPQPHHSRVDVDRAALELFERVYLDLDSTRDHFGESLSAHAAEVETLHARAVAAETAAAERVMRVRRDYTNGDITAAEWRELRGELESEHAAAVAERDRLASNIEAIRESRAELDAEAAVLRRLADLRSAVLERKRTAEQHADVEALRAALAQTFKEVVILPGGQLVWEGKAPMRLEGGKWHGSVPVPLPARTSQHGTCVWTYMTQKTLRPL